MTSVISGPYSEMLIMALYSSVFPNFVVMAHYAISVLCPIQVTHVSLLVWLYEG